MKIQPKVKKFQEGGPMGPAEAPVEDPAMAQESAPVEDPAAAGAEQDPMAMIMELAAQALLNQDCQAAMQLAQLIMEMSQQQAAPAEAPQGEPVYRRGGTLVRRVNK